MNASPRPLQWDDLRLLLAVARQGSMLRASQRLGLAPSTLSRRLSALEAELGVRLVERGASGCWTTPQGARLVELATRTASELEQIQDSLAGRFTGSFTVSSGHGFTPLLSRVIARFQTEHPDCRVDLVVDTDFLRLSRGEADLALRTGTGDEPDLVYERLGAFRYGYFASAALAARLESPGSAPFISFRPPLDRLPQPRAASAAGFRRIALRTNSFTAMLDATRAGVGVAALPRATASGLVEVFPEHPLPPQEVSLVSRASARGAPHLRAFAAFLREESLPLLSS